MTPPTVTVAIPVLNEASAIEECLERVLTQTVADVEIVVADGGSSDATRAIVDEVAGRDARVTLIDNPRHLQSAGLNEALAKASADVIVRLDARSFVEHDYLERCLALLRETGAAVVGGRMVARAGISAVSRGIALANGARWGAGPAPFHAAGAAGPADTVYLGAFQRSWLERMGGWAEDVGVNEDFELNHRIRMAGGEVWLDPGLEVGYQPRSDLRSLARQYFRYGRSKATVLRRHPGSLGTRQALPAFVVPVGLLAVLPGPGGRFGRSVVAAHIGALALLARRSPGPVAVRAAAGAAAWVMHWAWSAGFWFGVLRPFPPARHR